MNFVIMRKGKEETRMGKKSIISIEAVIDFIENHLDGKLELETVAEAVHYSKYHLHRLFTETVGMTIHDYVQRRQLTEAAKLLIFSDKPIIEISLSVVMKVSNRFQWLLNLCINHRLRNIVKTEFLSSAVALYFT